MTTSELKKGQRIVSVWPSRGVKKTGTVSGLGEKHAKITFDDGTKTQLAIWAILQDYEVNPA